jgi:Ubiquitin-conjugating enzyme
MQGACYNTCTAIPEKCANIVHCEKSRPILLYRLLSNLDRLYITERNQEKSRAQERERQQKLQAPGTGYATSRYGGSLFIHRYHSIFPQTDPSQKLQTVAKQRDDQLRTLFYGIAQILRNSSEPGLLNLMRISLLGQAVEELLRNDSISDCSERAGLYSAFLTALEAIASNPQLAEFYTSPREEIESTDGIERIMLGEGKLIKVKKQKDDWCESKEYEKVPSLLELMENLGKQAETFYKTVGTAALTATDRNVIISINLCKSIRQIRQLLQNTAIKAGHGNVIQPPTEKSEGTNSYRLACAEVAYDEFPSPDVPFGFSQRAQSLKSVNPRRTITLAKELSTMATSLPPGIFVRSAPNRPDCIKALVAGPEGTPYYGGLFEFDIFAPEEYPAVPPKVHLNTTANGQIRFNPNLYA